MNYFQFFLILYRWLSIDLHTNKKMKKNNSRFLFCFFNVFDIDNYHVDDVITLFISDIMNVGYYLILFKLDLIIINWS